MSSQIKVLFDTNVWLDRFLRDRPKGALCRRLIEQCATRSDDIAILYPLHTLNDVFWFVTRDIKKWVIESYGELTEAGARLSNARAWESIDVMSELGTPVAADVSDVWFARKLRSVHPDFEDDMVLAAAERAHVDYLVTSDERLILKATVAALKPEDMLSVLAISPT